MKTIFSPNNIDVLLHCYVSPEKHPRLEAPAVSEAIWDLAKVGAIERTEDPVIFRTTKLGVAWIKTLCNVPPPRMVYVDEHGRLLE